MPSPEPRILESKVTERILKWLRKQPGCFCFKVVAHPKQMTGVPDINCCWQGYYVAIEVKSPSNKQGPTVNQQTRMKQINEAGGVAFVARSLAQVKEELAKIGTKREATKKGP